MMTTQGKVCFEPSHAVGMNVGFVQKSPKSRQTGSSHVRTFSRLEHMPIAKNIMERDLQLSSMQTYRT
jgi:hypothetical protein